MQFRKWFGAFGACLFAWAIAHVSTAMAISQTQVLEAECDPSFNVFVVFKPVESWSADAQVQFRINFQHQRGGYVVRVTPSSVILFKVAGSNQQRLARSALPAFTRKHRWELTVQRRDGADRYRIAVLVNGSPIIAINDSTFRAGRAEYNATRLEIFIKPPRYQPIEPIYFMDDFTRAPDEPSLWNVVKGSWQVGHLMQAFTSRRRMLASERTSNPFAYIATPADDGIALAVSGYWFWESYTLDAAVRPDGNGIIGLIVFYQNPQSYLMLRWASQHASKDGDAQGAGARKAKSHKPSCELVWVVNGQERIVSRAPGGYEAGQWYRLTLRANCEKVEAFIDGKMVCTVANPPLVQGRIGLFVRGCEAVFDDVSAIHWDGSPQLQQRPHVKIAEQFQRERTMELWASPTGDWVDGGNEDGWRILWHRGDFFGDASISASLQLPTNSAGELKLLLYATPPRIDSGYSLTIRLYANGDEPSYELMVSKRMLKRGKLPLERFNGHWGGQLIFSHTANHLSVKVDEALISTVDVQGITHGLKVGVAMRGINIPHDAFTVTCTNLFDDTFACAPTDWWALRGLWIVFPRWPCDPSWGWFGGVNSESPVLWTKQAFYGDMTVEAFMALPMDLPTTPGYSHPSDLNITICGDGRNLDSGYSFIFAGWRNTKTAILRHEKVVAVTPNMRMRNPINTNMEFHRHWFYLRIERRGSKLRYFVDNQLALEYDDPQPLPGGRVALWTFHNGLMVARVRIWYERIGDAPPLPCTHVPDGMIVGSRNDKPMPVGNDVNAIVHDFEDGLCGWSPRGIPGGAVICLDDSTASHGKRSLKIMTPLGGGHFTVWAGIGAFDAKRFRILQFDYKLPASVRVNLYVKVNNRYHAFEFTGGEQPYGTAVMLGKIENVIADNEWHTATVRLYDALRKRYPRQTSFRISEVCFSVPDETYLRCGIGGNHYRDSYHIDNFKLLASH